MRLSAQLGAALSLGGEYEVNWLIIALIVIGVLAVGVGLFFWLVSRAVEGSE